MKSLDAKKLIIKALLFVLFFYLFGKCGQAFRLAQGVDLSGKLLNINGGFAAAELPPTGYACGRCRRGTYRPCPASQAVKCEEIPQGR